MSNISPSRILAVEVRSARFGFALLEEPRRLLDFGAAWYESPATARLRFCHLLEVSRPTLLVLRKEAQRKTALSKSIASIIHREAKKCSVPVICITERSFKTYYDSRSRHTKYDRAVFLATLFPEIAWRLPSKRKFYEPEPLAMIYFDSVALVAAYLELSNGNVQTEVR